MTTFHHGQPNYYTPLSDLSPKAPFLPPPRTTPPIAPPPREKPQPPPTPQRSQPPTPQRSQPPTPQRSLPHISSGPLPPPIPQKTRTKVGGPKQVQLASPPLSLTEFVQEYSMQLPLQLKVLRGYCGPSSRLTISTDDMFNIHLVKRAKVVRVTDAHGTVYIVPLNSSIEFGLVYDPMESRGSAEAVAGFKLRVSDLVMLDSPPKVLCCLKQWMDGGKVVLTEREQLVIRGVQKSRLKSKKSLKVFSLRTKQEVLLPEDCPALFSTESSLVKMLLVELLEYVEDPLPNTAMVHLDAEIYQNPSTAKKVHDLPDILLSRVVEMSEVVVETSLISSAVIDKDASYLDSYSEEELHQMVDIPLEGGLLDIEVAVVDVDETDQLYEDTRGIYEAFSPLKVKPMRDLLSDRSAAAQSLFSLAVRTGYETHGIELNEPSYNYVKFSNRREDGALPPATPPVSVSRSGSVHSVRSSGRGSIRSNGSGGREDSAPKLPPREEKSKEKEKERHKKTEQEPVRPPRPKKATPQATPPQTSTDGGAQQIIPGVRGQRSTGRCRNDDSLLDGSGSSCEELSCEDEGVFRKIKSPGMGLDRRIAQVEDRVAALEASGGHGSGRGQGGDGWKDAVQQMQKRIRELEQQVKQLKSDSQYASVPSLEATPIYDVCGESAQSNKDYLRQMTLQQVLSMLEVMELQRYQEVFRAEYVSGDILAELGEEELKEDLGIQSKLHRLRLLKIINGQQSPASIMSGSE